MWRLYTNVDIKYILYIGWLLLRLWSGISILKPWVVVWELAIDHETELLLDFKWVSVACQSGTIEVVLLSYRSIVLSQFWALGCYCPRNLCMKMIHDIITLYFQSWGVNSLHWAPNRSFSFEVDRFGRFNFTCWLLSDGGKMLSTKRLQSTLRLR